MYLDPDEPDKLSWPWAKWFDDLVQGNDHKVIVNANDKNPDYLIDKLTPGTAIGITDSTSSARISVLFGDTSSTACIGNDSRLTNSRPPTAHAVTHKPAGTDPLATAIAGSSAPGDAAAIGSAEAFSKADHKHGRESYGTRAGTVAQGNDSRFNKVKVTTDDTTPDFLSEKIIAPAFPSGTYGGLTLTVQDPAGYEKINVGINAVHPTIGIDAEINAPKVNDDCLDPDNFMANYKDGIPSALSLRTLGTLSNQAAAGDDPRFSENYTVKTSISDSTAGYLVAKLEAGMAMSVTENTSDPFNYMAKLDVLFGTQSDQACVGNDARLSNDRTALSHGFTGDKHSIGTLTDMNALLSDGSVISTLPGEFSSLGHKASPTLTDQIMIEDAADSFNKKYSTIGEALSASPSAGGKVKVSSDDTSPGFLVDKLEALMELYQGGLTLTVQDPAGDEAMKIGINAVHPTIGIDAEINAIKVNDFSLTPDHFCTAYVDGLPSIPSLRTLGTLSNQAAAGNDPRFGALPAAHDLAGAQHIADTITNLNTKLTDGTVISTKSGEIFALTSKATPTTSDLLMIEDAADANNKKKILISALPAAAPAVHSLAGALHSADSITNLNLKLTDGTVISTKSGEINALTLKTSPIRADKLMIEDSAATWAKKAVLIDAMPIGRQISFAAPVVVGDYYEFGSVSGSSTNSKSVRLTIAITGTGISIAKQYLVSARYDYTGGAWELVTPTVNTQQWGLQDLVLCLSMSNATLTFRLLRRTGTTAATVYVTIEQIGGEGNAWTTLSNTGSAMALPTNTYPDNIVPCNVLIMERTLPAAPDDYVEIGTFTPVDVNGMQHLRMSIQYYTATTYQATLYDILLRNNQTAGVWQRVYPIEAAHGSATAPQTYQLEINNVTSSTAVTLRIVRNTGTGVPLAHIRLYLPEPVQFTTKGSNRIWVELTGTGATGGATIVPYKPSSPILMNCMGNEYYNLQEKTIPVGADVMLLEDSASTYLKKKITLANIFNSVAASRVQQISFAAPEVVGDYYEFASATLLGHNLRISIYVEGSTWTISKQYLLPLGYNTTSNTWYIIEPISYDSNTITRDLDLCVNVNNSVATFRLVRTVGVNAATVYAIVENMGSSADVFAVLTATGSMTVPTAFFDPTFAQWGGIYYNSDTLSVSVPTGTWTNIAMTTSMGLRYYTRSTNFLVPTYAHPASLSFKLSIDTAPIFAVLPGADLYTHVTYGATGTTEMLRSRTRQTVWAGGWECISGTISQNVTAGDLHGIEVFQNSGSTVTLTVARPSLLMVKLRNY
jgi:hypothetical protein